MAEVISMVSVNELVAQIKTAWDRADEAQADANKRYIRIGQMLIELKKRVGHGNWMSTLQKLGRSKSHAQFVMRCAKGTDSAENHNKRTKRTRRTKKIITQRQRKGKAKDLAIVDLPQSGFSKPGQPDSEDQEQYFNGSDPNLVERWGYSLGNLCGDIIAIAPYWNKEFPQWRDYECPRHIQKLLMDAIAALGSISTAVKRGRKAS